MKSTAKKKLGRGESQKGEDKRRRRSEMEKVRREKMQVHEKVGKLRNTVFFQCFVAPEGRKVGSLKRRVRRHLARWEMKSCTPLWREAHLEVKSVNTHHARSTFGSWDVEKVHAVVAQAQMAIRCPTSARHCGAKHIWKSNMPKTKGGFEPLLMCQMSFCWQIDGYRKVS